MPVVQINPVLLLAPAFVIGAYIGYRRGWHREAFTAAGLVLAIVILGRGAEDAMAVINGVLARLGRALGLILGVEPKSPPRLTVSPGVEPLVTFVLFVLLVVLAYLAGTRLGRRFSVDHAGRLFGALIGGLNLFVVMSRVLGGLRQSGPTSLGASGLNIRIPSFSGVNIVVPPPPESALLIAWPLAAIVFLLVAMLVYVLVRMARA